MPTVPDRVALDRLQRAVERAVNAPPPPPVTYVTPTITIEVHSAAGKADLLKAIQFLAGLA